MKRVMLTVSYDGTNYCGWQIQPNAVTIEEKLNEALTHLTGEQTSVSGCSRTDTGVHAKCNLAVFDTNMQMPADKFSFALNQRLPEDIRIVKSQEVDLDFHPRKCDTRKTYIYRIYQAKFANPIIDRYAHFTYYALDVEQMKEAAAFLVGEHDFKSFCSAKAQVLSTVREIYECNISEKELEPGKLIEIKVTGNGFLYNMVRIIAGTLLEVGRGKMKPQQIINMLENVDRQCAGPTAPAKGLMLEKYEFSSEYSIKIY